MTCAMCADGVRDWGRQKHTKHEIILIKNNNSNGTKEMIQKLWTLAIYASSVSVIKHHKQGSLSKNGYIWVYGSTVLESMMVESRE